MGLFVEGEIEGEKVFNGRVFPKTLIPPKTCKLELAEMVKMERGELVAALRDHGAILFRGFAGVGSPEDFSQVVRAFGWDDFGYQGAADRVMMADRVFTANAVPLHISLPFHHEMSMIKKYPRRIMFFCQQPPPEGGQTSIIPSSVVVEEMQKKAAEVVAKMVKDGIIFRLHTKAAFKNTTETLWQRMLKTTDEVEGEKRALDMLACNSAKFNSDGTADFIFGPMNPIRELDGKRVMFSQVLGYELGGERDAFVTFADGSPLPSDAIDTCKKIYEENCVDVNWQAGDVLVLDNYAVQHARRPGKAPRVVLVSLSI